MAESKNHVSLQDLKEKFQLSDQLLDTYMSDEHLREASRIIPDHRLLGRELGFTSVELDVINQEQPQELQRIVMLEKWKQKSSWRATYQKLIEALLKVRRTDVAQEVCEWLAQTGAPPGQLNASADCSTAFPTSLLGHHTATGTDGQQHGKQQNAPGLHTPPQSPLNAAEAHSISREEQPPVHIVDAPMVSKLDLGQVEGDPSSQVLKEVESLEKGFINLLDATSEHLEERKVPLHKLRRSLFVHRASDTQTDVDVVAGHRHEIREADTVNDLFDILSTGKCWDFLNPGLLKRIIDDHCCEAQGIQQQKGEYLEKLQYFRKTTSAQQFAKVCKVSTPSPKVTEVVFEMGIDWDNATLEDVENLKQEIRGQGYLIDHVLNFKRSKNSSISLVWTFPRSCPISTTLLRIPPSFYLEHGIRRVLAKGVCVVDVKFEEQKEVVAEQLETRLQLQERLEQKEKDIISLKETIEVMASAEKMYTEKLKEALKAAIESNQELVMGLEDAKTMQQALKMENSYLKDHVRKMQMEAAGLTERSVSNAPLLHAMEQEKVLKKKDIKIADYEDKRIHLTKEVETLKKDILLRQHEDRERQLLEELKRMKGVEGRKPTPHTGSHYVESRGIRYNMKRSGVGGNTAEVMILVSVGSEFPSELQVQPRVKDPALADKAIQIHGSLPPMVAELYKEAAADLMARVNLGLESSNADVVRLCLDVPGKQRSKEYYLNTIKEYLKGCQQPVAVLIYLGHSEEGTGDWCFKDGTISFKEVFNIYRRYCPGKLLYLMPDCCYSGHWVNECAKTLDGLGIPPCGHRAREQGILLKLYASCQPDQKAAEPCYSVEGVTRNEDRTLIFWAKQLSEHQTSLYCDATRLTCCRNPDEPCRSDEVLKNWTWQDALDRGLVARSYIVQGKERGQPVWHYVLLSNHKSEEQFEEEVKSGSVDISKWGYVISSGQEENPPQGTLVQLSRCMRV